ncbi:MAG TPA: hypothetical protein VFP97_15615, partial [Chitinophagaceae bacterium]|nr:hypothetical protein [Chitinophagaceae bacterium]
LNSRGDIVSPEKRQAELSFLKETRFADGEEFLKKYNEFAETDGRIVSLFNDDSKTYAEWIGKNEHKVNEEFNKAEAIVKAMRSYQVSEKAKKKVDLLEQLLHARKEEVSIIKKLSTGDNDADQRKRLEIQKKEENIVNELKKS